MQTDVCQGGDNRQEEHGHFLVLPLVSFGKFLLSLPLAPSSPLTQKREAQHIQALFFHEGIGPRGVSMWR